MSVRKSFKQTIESTFRKFENSFVCIDFICNEMRNIYVNNDFSKSSEPFFMGCSSEVIVYWLCRSFKQAKKSCQSSGIKIQ